MRWSHLEIRRRVKEVGCGNVIVVDSYFAMVRNRRSLRDDKQKYKQWQWLDGNGNGLMGYWTMRVRLTVRVRLALVAEAVMV